MPLSPRAYVRLPADGSGKALVADFMVYIDYVSATQAIPVGSRVVGATSATFGTVVQSIPNGAQGRLGVHLAFPNLAEDFEVGERLILDEPGTNDVEVCTIQFIEFVYVSRGQVVGSNNPNFGQRVDKIGAASVRFSEGSPSFDAFGRMQVSEALMLGEYRTPYDRDDERFSYGSTGGGTAVYEGNSQGVILRVGTAAGDRSIRTTNKYHAYQPGSSQLAQMSLSLSHSVQAGARYRWGYYDDTDGLFFENDGGTMAVGVRSSTSGSVLDRIIERKDWNGDKLDGTGDSGIVLDVNNLSLWWIDFGWYGANRIRFGIYDGNGRIVCHTEENANVRPRAYMRTGRLPLRWEVENLSATGSTTEMYVLSASVKAEGQIDRPHIAYGGVDAPAAPVTGAGWGAVYGCRAAALFKGRTNRVFVLPKSATVVATDATTGEPAAVIVGVIKDPVEPIVNEAWIAIPSNPNSSVEFNPYSGGQAVVGGRLIGAWSGVGSYNVDLADHFSYTNGEFIGLNADQSQTPYYIVARPIDPTKTINVHIVSNWHEVQ